MVSRVIRWRRGSFRLAWLAPLPTLLFGGYLQPLNVILGLFGDELDALEDVGDVIDAPFLHLQYLSCPVQVDNAISRAAQQLQEAFGGQIQRCLIA